MGVYIKDMEIPKEYGPHEIKIVLFVRSDGTASIWGKEVYIPHEPIVAIPVPEHGRLIDANALVRSYYHAPSFPNLCKAINDATTIIPADKEIE